MVMVLDYLCAIIFSFWSVKHMVSNYGYIKYKAPMELMPDKTGCLNLN